MLIDVILDDLLVDVELDARGVLPGVAETLQEVDGLRRLYLLVGQVRSQPALPAHQQRVSTPYHGQQLLQGRSATQAINAFQAEKLLGR